MNYSYNISENVTQFWDQSYRQHNTKIPQNNDPMLIAALEHFGSLEGKKILDLGCGDGRTSLFFAQFGAEVVAIDISLVAVENLKRFCQDNQINNIESYQLSALEIDQMGEFDFVFGSMILHHIEPFPLFVEKLRTTLKPGGKAFFYENSAMSSLLIWCRDNLVGKFGIHKGGDDEEFPLTPGEINQLCQQFSVHILYPEFLFFRLFSQYILKYHFHDVTKKLDQYFYQFPTIRKYSYRQFLLIS